MKSEILSTAVETENGDTLKLEAKVFHAEETTSDSIFFCLPGGGASRHYFDLGMFDSVDYSFASRMTKLGHSVIAMDNPGTGSNTFSSIQPFLKPRESSKYIAHVANFCYQNLASNSSKMIGLGHSMGGMMTVLTQARHRPFSGIALLGSSADGLDWGLDEHEKTYIDHPAKLENDLEQLVLRKFRMPFPGPLGGPSGKSITFGGASEEITERLREIAIPLYAAGGMMSMIKGSFMPEVEAIDVPLFFAFGDHDIGAPPEEAPLPFANAKDIELHILENCGHNSFAFPVIEQLCAKIDSWSLKV